MRSRQVFAGEIEVNGSEASECWMETDSGVPNFPRLSDNEVSIKQKHDFYSSEGHNRTFQPHQGFSELVK